MSTTKFAKRMKTIKVPEGFLGILTKQTLGYSREASEVFILEKVNDTRIEFWEQGNGSTNFTKVAGVDEPMLTFDRYGVEASFYHQPLWEGDTTKYDLNEIVKEQLERIAEQRAYYTTAIPVPGIPHTVSPETKVSLTKRLKKTGQISFRPSGFGTGYIVTARMVRGAKPAPKAMVDFFGVGQLYISTIEMD